MGRNYSVIDRPFHTSMALGHLLDDAQPNHDYEQQQRSMVMMNGATNLPQWSMPPMNFTPTPVVK